MPFLHFRLGPVQSFVQQARKTRDYHAGSLLLSWLSGIAMIQVEKQGGKIRLPLPNRRFLNAIESGENGPDQGVIPNQFMAEVRADCKPEQAVKALKYAWHNLAERVWRQDLAEYADSRARSIWDHQLEHYWDAAWVLTDHKEDISALNQRKAIRRLPPHNPALESGALCSLVSGLAEISNRRHKGLGAVKRFWRPIRKVFSTDLADDEFLSGIGIIKRRFIRHFNAAFDTGCGWQAHGWRVNPAVPSVTYMAAADWLAETLREAGPERFNQLADALKGHDLGYAERGTRIACIQQAVNETGGDYAIAHLDGQAFFTEAIGRLEHEGILDRGRASNIQIILQQLHKDGGPNPYYAILLMDGDSLGQHLRDGNAQNMITQALKQFTQTVPNQVREHSGFLIYLGGDDVAAFLPVTQALNCAVALRKNYIAAFAETGLDCTISAAVAFTHIKCSLTHSLEHCHTLLDETAKAACGRDALAVSVRNTGGILLNWSSKWSNALADDSQLRIQSLATRIQTEDNQFPVLLSSGLLYRLQRTFAVINGRQGGRQSVGHLAWHTSDLLDLIIAELKRDSRNPLSEGTAKTANQYRELAKLLLSQCLSQDGRLKLDGGMLARFLACKGAV